MIDGGLSLTQGKHILLIFPREKWSRIRQLPIYRHPLKVTESVKFLGVHIDNHLHMKQHTEHIERASLISRIARLNSVNATLLIRLYKIFTRPYMDYACTALTQLNKLQRHKLEVIQNRSLRYTRRTVDSTCISNSEQLSRCNIVSAEQCILALADSWWKKASKNNHDIISFTYHHQTDNKTETPLNVIKGNKFF